MLTLAIVSALGLGAMYGLIALGFNQFTVIVKSSTLVSVIAVQDLMFQSQKIVNIWYEPIQYLPLPQPSTSANSAGVSHCGDESGRHSIWYCRHFAAFLRPQRHGSRSATVRAPPTSLDTHPRRLDDFAPLGAFGLDDLGECLGRVAYRLVAL